MSRARTPPACHRPHPPPQGTRRRGRCPPPCWHRPRRRGRRPFFDKAEGGCGGASCSAAESDKKPTKTTNAGGRSAALIQAAPEITIAPTSLPGAAGAGFLCGVRKSGRSQSAQERSIDHPSSPPPSPPPFLPGVHASLVPSQATLVPSPPSLRPLAWLPKASTSLAKATRVPKWSARFTSREAPPRPSSRAAARRTRLSPAP
jgi:hypothetical protein